MERLEHGVTCGLGWVVALGRQVLNRWPVGRVRTAPCRPVRLDLWCLTVEPKCISVLISHILGTWDCP